MRTPGGMVEWAASDGRKGKLTGPGTVRLSEHHVSSKKGSVKGGTAKAQEKANVGGDDGPGLFGLFDGPLAGNDDNTPAPKPTTSSDWSQEDDKRLMDWKSENPSAAWQVFAGEIGKTKEQCQERFKEIKPKDWKPTGAGGKGAGGAKKEKNKGKGQNQNQKNQKKQSQNGNDIMANDGLGGTATNQWDTTNAGWENSGGNDINPVASSDKGNTWEINQMTSGDNANTWDFNTPGNNDNSWENKDAGGDGWNNDTWGNNDTGGNPWDKKSKKSRSRKSSHAIAGGADTGVAIDNNPGPWDTMGAQNNEKTDWDGPWGEPAAPAKSAPKAASSHRKTSHKSVHHRSERHRTQSNIGFPVELEVKPDDQFSGDDLRLIAKILQQDSKMVWDRVSWRFSDKTGRHLSPDDIEKKITGYADAKKHSKEKKSRA